MGEKAIRGTMGSAEDASLMKEIMTRQYQIAAAHMEFDESDMDKAIETSQEVVVSTGTVELNLMHNPPYCYGSAVGLVRSNAATQVFAVVAATDHKLPSPRFGAFSVTFSNEMQTATCVPVERYDRTNPRHYAVTWSKDGSEWRCEMGPLLKEKGWMAPLKKMYEIPVTIRRHHPKVGTALILWFRKAEIVESDYVRKKKSEEANAAKNAAAAAAKAAAKAAAEAAAKAAAEAAAKAEEEKAAKAAAEAAAKAAAEAAKDEEEKTATATEETKPSGSTEGNA